MAQGDIVDLTDENLSAEPAGEQPPRGVIVKDEFGDVPGISEPPTVPPTVPEPETGRGKRARKKPVLFSPKHTGKSHDSPRKGHIHVSIQEGDELACDQYYRN